MKHIRVVLLLSLFAALGACTTMKSDLKSPCACDDGVQPHINQEA